jgi:Ca2+/Na+ antiporter
MFNEYLLTIFIFFSIGTFLYLSIRGSNFRWEVKFIGLFLLICIFIELYFQISKKSEMVEQAKIAYDVHCPTAVNDAAHYFKDACQMAAEDKDTYVFKLMWDDWKLTITEIFMNIKENFIHWYLILSAFPFIFNLFVGQRAAIQSFGSAVFQKFFC